MSENARVNAKIRWVPRHGTLEEWEKSNPILLAGEIGIVTDGTAGEFQKVGDGVKCWKDLPWKSGPQGIKGEKGDKGEDNPAYTDYAELREECEAAVDEAERAAKDAAAVRAEVAAGGFIESLKEQNGGEKFTVWVGTQKEYDAIENRGSNCLYIIEDDSTLTPSDYIIAQGTAESGGAIWTYEKWNSGKAVCYCVASQYITIDNVWLENILNYGTGTPVTYPAEVSFIEPPICIMQKNNYEALSILEVGKSGSATETPTPRLICGSSVLPHTYEIAFYAVGKWK